MAKTRPLPGSVYESFRALGASPKLTLIGYREPFCFLGWKGAKPGDGCFALDAKKQSKQMCRLDAVVTLDGASIKSMAWSSKEVKILEELGGEPAPKKAKTK